MKKLVAVILAVIFCLNIAASGAVCANAAEFHTVYYIFPHITFIPPILSALNTARAKALT